MKANYEILSSSKKRTKLTILSTEGAQDSEFRSFFGRIQDAIIWFRDLLTFRSTVASIHPTILDAFSIFRSTAGGGKYLKSNSVDWWIRTSLKRPVTREKLCRFLEILFAHLLHFSCVAVELEPISQTMHQLGHLKKL